MGKDAVDGQEGEAGVGGNKRIDDEKEAFLLAGEQDN